MITVPQTRPSGNSTTQNFLFSESCSNVMKENHTSRWSGGADHTSGGSVGPHRVSPALPDQQLVWFSFYTTAESLNTLFHYS